MKKRLIRLIVRLLTWLEDRLSSSVDRVRYQRTRLQYNQKQFEQYEEWLKETYLVPFAMRLDPSNQDPIFTLKQDIPWGRSPIEPLIHAQLKYGKETVITNHTKEMNEDEV